jgi:hypothetical protein
LRRTELRSQCSRALVALTGIPVDIPSTGRTAPPECLLFGPRIKAYLPLPLDALQDLSMMRQSIFAEVRQWLARRIRALATVPDPLLQGTCPKFTVAAYNGHHVIRQTPIAGQVLCPDGLSLLDCEHLGDLFEQSLVTALARQKNGASPAIEAAGRDQLLTFTVHEHPHPRLPY